MQRLESKQMATGVSNQPTLKEVIQTMNEICASLPECQSVVRVTRLALSRAAPYAGTCMTLLKRARIVKSPVIAVLRISANDKISALMLRFRKLLD
jgi:hypothetical protein